MSVFGDVRAGSRAKLLASNAIPAKKIAWEGVFYTVSPGDAYVSEAIIPGPATIAVGGGVEAARTFYLNYTIHCPAGIGTKALEDIADAIHAAFRPGQWIVYGSHKISTQMCSRTGIRQDAGWIACTVTASVLAHTFEG